MKLTPADADKRIMLSRRTLSGWTRVNRSAPAEEYAARASAEVGVLDAIAAEHPGKAAKIARLIADWRAFVKGLAH